MNSRELLGREREIVTLLQRIEADALEGSVLLVTGEPGIGKSALVAEARTRADTLDHRVLCTAGVESETHLPFGGLQQLTRPQMGSVGIVDTAEGLFLDGLAHDLAR